MKHIALFALVLLLIGCAQADAAVSVKEDGVPSGVTIEYLDIVGTTIGTDGDVTISGNTMVIDFTDLKNA